MSLWVLKGGVKWVGFILNSICYLEKLFRLREILYCFSFVVCLILYIKKLNYGFIGLYNGM